VLAELWLHTAHNWAGVAKPIARHAATLATRQTRAVVLVVFVVLAMDSSSRRWGLHSLRVVIGNPPLEGRRLGWILGNCLSRLPKIGQLRIGHLRVALEVRFQPSVEGLGLLAWGPERTIHEDRF
jgi:hypothetical protein